jgi:hypothetical protein
MLYECVIFMFVVWKYEAHNIKHMEKINSMLSYKTFFIYALPHMHTQIFLSIKMNENIKFI